MVDWLGSSSQLLSKYVFAIDCSLSYISLEVRNLCAVEGCSEVRNLCAGESHIEVKMAAV